MRYFPVLILLFVGAGCKPTIKPEIKIDRDAVDSVIDRLRMAEQQNQPVKSSLPMASDETLDAIRHQTNLLEELKTKVDKIPVTPVESEPPLETPFEETTPEPDSETIPEVTEPDESVSDEPPVEPKPDDEPPPTEESESSITVTKRYLAGDLSLVKYYIEKCEGCLQWQHDEYPYITRVKVSGVNCDKRSESFKDKRKLDGYPSFDILYKGKSIYEFDRSRYVKAAEINKVLDSLIREP